MTVVGFLVVFKRNGTGIADGHTGVFSAVHNGRIGLCYQFIAVCTTLRHCRNLCIFPVIKCIIHNNPQITVFCFGRTTHNRSILRNKCNKEFIIYAFYNFTFRNKTGSAIFFTGIGHNGYLHARQNILDSHETSGTKFFHQLSDYTFDIVYIL